MGAPPKGADRPPPPPAVVAPVPPGNAPRRRLQSRRRRAQPPAAKPVPGDATTKPKIIRTGEMEFEVDSFESAVSTITKVVEEEGGYVSTTNSDKLPNGKVKGSIVLRVAPERLDTLVLKLRGVGDLHTQNIRAQDITKQFTDMESKLKAAQVMQDRLLDIIKNGKGAVKDLLEAEKQLGIVREALERLEGEIRYYNHQVALSTLTLTLFERDIRSPAVATETDVVTMSLETETVPEADAKAKDAISGRQAKGRIASAAALSRMRPARCAISTIAAQVPPDAAEACIARLRQIEGHVARFDRQRNQTTSNGNAPVDAILGCAGRPGQAQTRGRDDQPHDLQPGQHRAAALDECDAGRGERGRNGSCAEGPGADGRRGRARIADQPSAPRSDGRPGAV